MDIVWQRRDYVRHFKVPTTELLTVEWLISVVYSLINSFAEQNSRVVN